VAPQEYSCGDQCNGNIPGYETPTAGRAPSTARLADAPEDTPVCGYRTAQDFRGGKRFQVGISPAQASTTSGSPLAVLAHGQMPSPRVQCTIAACSVPGIEGRSDAYSKRWLVFRRP
jgi:hypothetical protein